MTFEELQAIMPAGIAVGVVRSSFPDKHWNARFWTTEKNVIARFELILSGYSDETVEHLIERAMPVVRAAVIALGLS
jgi:hypothetical protein